MRSIKWLFALALLAAAGYGLWRGAQWGLAAWNDAGAQAALVARLEGEVRSLRQRTEELNRREVSLAEGAQHTGAEVSALGARVAAGEDGLRKLADAVEGGRTRLQLASVEQLLLAAADRLQLAHDFAGALSMLDAADERLAKLSDPRLFKVREALKSERNALTAAAVPDVTGATVSLNELLRAAGKLPLRGRAPARYETPAAPPAAPDDDSLLSRIWAAVRTALANIFALHRLDVPPPRWLPEEQQALVSQVLQLKLEGARLALLARDGRTLHELADGAREWLDRYYDDSDPAVKQAAVELDALRRLNLSPPVPEIGRSLALLRTVLDAR